MKRYHSINLRWWLPVTILGAFTLMLSASSLWRYQQASSQLEQRTQEMLTARLANLQHRMEGLLRLNQNELAAEEIADFGSNLEVTALALVDEQGRVLQATRRIWLGQAIAEAMPGFDAQHFASIQQQRRLALRLDTAQERIIAYQPVALAAHAGEIRPSRVGMLLLDYSLASAKAELRDELWREALNNLVISLITMALLIMALQYWLSRPLNYLRSAVKRISQGDFKTPVTIVGRGELVELGSAVNKMQADLAQARIQTQDLIHSLRAREAELKKITDALPGPISRIDETGRYVFVSAAYQRWFGKRPEQVVGRLQREVIGPELYALLEPYLQSARAGQSSTFEARIPHPNGGMRDAMVTVLPDFDNEGAVCGYYTIGVDISERKRGEERFRYAVEASPNAMIMVDAQGSIVLVNSRTSELFGYTEQELLGQPLNLLIPKQYHQTHTLHVKDFIEQSMEHKMGVGRELLGLHKDGHEIPLEIGLNPLQTNEGRFVIASAIDITERKLAMAILREKNAELERYSYMVSHDLKSPLVTIKTFLGYLKEDMTKGDMARIDKDLDFIGKAADKMGQLLDELLEMSRIGRVVSLPVHINWRDALDEALTINAGAIAQRGVTVTVADTDVMLLGERPRLVQIWQNLVDNAVKFMGDQPAPQIRIGVTLGAPGAIFYVCDNGIGVDTRYHDKIFGIFEKLDASVPGSGLGLALVQRIVQLYRGDIRIESQGVGHGACFYFTLPEAVQQRKGTS